MLLNRNSRVWHIIVRNFCCWLGDVGLLRLRRLSDSVAGGGVGLILSLAARAFVWVSNTWKLKLLDNSNFDL